MASDPSLSKIPTSYATVSLDNGAEYTLPQKLQAISAAGFDAIELGFPDILTFATQHLGHEVFEDAYEELCTAGAEIKKLVAQNKLQILMLQPFSNFEGWPKDSDGRKDAFSRAKGWIKIMQAVGTDMLQVGSSDTPDITSDIDLLASDLAELADMLAEHKFRLCYENWCWATHATTWSEVWEIVKKVDRDNIGLCLDTFQTAGGEWGDPTTRSGRLETMDATILQNMYVKSLQNLAKTIPKDKIYLLQISDAYQLEEPMKKEPDEEGLRPRGRWSHDFRPMPFDGGYLPILPVTKAVLDTGFRGYFSVEIFDGGPEGKGRPKDAEQYTKKAKKSLDRLIEEANVYSL